MAPEDNLLGFGSSSFRLGLKNEIVIAQLKLFDYVPVFPDDIGDESELPKYLNSKVKLDLSKYGLGNEEFIVVGIYDDVDYPSVSEKFDFMFNREMFDFLHRNLSHYKLIYSLITFLGDKKSENNALIKDLSFSSDIRHSTAFSEELYHLRDNIKSLGSIINAVCFIISLFAALLLLTFIKINIDNKRRELGLLRAIGARKIDILKIFVIETCLIVGLVNVLAPIASLFVVDWINNEVSKAMALTIPFFYIDHVNIIVNLLLSSIVAFGATVLPIMKIAKESPINALKKS